MSIHSQKDIVVGERYKSNHPGLCGVVYMGCQTYEDRDTSSSFKRLVILVDEYHSEYIGTMVIEDESFPIWVEGFQLIKTDLE